MKRIITLAGLCLFAATLHGCATRPETEAQLEAARSKFQAVKEDSDVLRFAPKDVIRAGESLARADRLSSYWGSDADVAHFAYLSQRYSAIAQQHTALKLNEERTAKLELERERLQLALREAKLLSVQQQGNWLSEQLVSLASNDGQRGLVMTLGDMLFDAGEADLSNAANRTVLKLVQFLQLNPKRVVRIEGYTDSRGDKQANLDLSRARAQAVADALVDLGIDAKRLQVEGYGPDFPVADNASERGRAQNRRVEVVFSDDQGRLSDSR